MIAATVVKKIIRHWRKINTGGKHSRRIFHTELLKLFSRRLLECNGYKGSPKTKSNLHRSECDSSLPISKRTALIAQIINVARKRKIRRSRSFERISDALTTTFKVMRVFLNARLKFQAKNRKFEPNLLGKYEFWGDFWASFLNSFLYASFFRSRRT